jgi:hypothetical protein
LVKFSAANKAPGNLLDAMSQGAGGPIGATRNRGKRHRSGERQDLAAPESSVTAATLDLSSNPAKGRRRA